MAPKAPPSNPPPPAAPPGQPAAKQGDLVVALDTHIIMIPSPGGPVPTPTPMPFSGQLDDSLSPNVSVDGQALATEGSVADNSPAHIPAGGPFQKPPTNKATVKSGSSTVFASGKAVARAMDPAMTCNDPTDAPNGQIIAVSTVFVGG